MFDRFFLAVARWLAQDRDHVVVRRNDYEALRIRCQDNQRLLDKALVENSKLVLRANGVRVRG